ncbi:DUF86 domain-containing protein [Candidatus Micrarchaeota archaeon]|nr:DUF86 domain-containing protein [Candidatus Micrarchaeota archaeon]
MIDKEQIAIMIKDIERYLSDLSEMSINTKKDLQEKEAYYALSMVIFAVMNRVIDIGNEIITGSEKIPIPGSYRETFELLSKNGVINSEVAINLTKLMKYRNVIAHEYYHLSTDELFKLKKDIYSVEKFIQEIKKFLKT